MKKKIVIFSGAGLDRESGVLTFRDCKDGLWNNHKIEDVATPSGWANDRKKVLEFYNERRRQMPEVLPNDAHKLIGKLEENFEVINVTQNVSDLLERGGATNVIHLHGELTKARGCMYNNKVSPIDTVVDVGYNDINIGDKCPTTDSQLRPHIVWFGEYPLGVNEAYKAVQEADILVIVGTSLQIGYTLDLLNQARRDDYDGKEDCRVIYIDPEPMTYLNNYGITVEYVRKKAVEGITEFVNELIK